MILVSALFIDPEGPYPQMPDVDCWDETRDAFKFDGNNPVICHPPCGPWGKLSHFSKQDASGGPFSIGTVQRLGGVLEHPVGSKMWKMYGLPAPGAGSDKYGGYTLAVEQVSYGHVARKPTWLYVVRAPRPELRTGGIPTHSVCNGRGQRLSDGTRRERCTAKQARLTPPAFAELLVSIARSVQQA